MKKTLNTFFCSDLYIVLIMFLSFINWLELINYTLYIPILTLIIVLYCFISHDSRGLIPIILSMLIANVFAFNGNKADLTELFDKLNYPLLGSCLCLSLISMIYFYIKNKRSIENVSILGLSLIGMFISFTLSDIVKSKSFDFMNFGFIVLLFYFIRHTIDYYRMKESFLPYFSKTIFYFSITIAIQVITYYALHFTLDSPLTFGPELGWSNHNGVSMVLILTIPIAAYSLFYTQNPGYFVGLLILITANLLTTSRGGILAMVIMIPLLILNNYRKYKSRRQFLQGIFITIIYFFIIIIFFEPYIAKIIKMLFYDGLNDSGRFDLWRQAFDVFLKNPILGGGSYIIHNKWYHSTIFDTLGMFGILGIITFGFHFIAKYINVFNERSTFKWFVLVGYLSSGFYGLIDVAYFNFIYLIIYVIILAVIEHTGGYLSHTKKD